MPQERRSTRIASVLLFVACLPLFTLGGCGGGSNAASSPSIITSEYQTAYKSLTWQSAATVTFPSNCEIKIVTTGVPPYHNAYYLAPTSTQYPTTVAYTPVSNMPMSVSPYMPSAITPATQTIDICPSAAAATTPTNLGVIGYMLSGEAIFNPYEGGTNPPPALSDNVSYTFTAGGITYTAMFIDQCNSHPTPLSNGYDWHHHGVPTCLVGSIDGATGPSHIIGIALDGFPIYGGRDINGNIVATSQLDACNGITSPTPEFPSGAYHYVLPLNVTGSQSSINCYRGAVNAGSMAQATKLACRMNIGRKLAVNTPPLRPAAKPNGL